MGKKIVIKGADFSAYAVGASSSEEGDDSRVSITFDTNGVGSVPSRIVEQGTTVELPIPSMEGYEFLGWFKDTLYTVSAGTSIEAEANTVLYAKWNSVSTTIYNANDWQVGKYVNMSACGTVGSIVSIPGFTNGTRLCGKKFNIVAGQALSLVTKVASPSTAAAYYTVIASDDPKEVLVARDKESDLLATPFVYTAERNCILCVNLTNGLDTNGENYDAEKDYRDEFRLVIKTPINYENP